MADTGLFRLVSDLLGPAGASLAFAQLTIAPALLRPPADTLSRAELAQALNMALFVDLLKRVPVGAAYVAELQAAGYKVVFDHGALRTVAWDCGSLPAGEAAIARVLRPLGFEPAATYPLPRLRMTGRAWRHQDLPQDIAQFFVSELHPERFSAPFQAAVSRVVGASRDPLSPGDLGLLQRLQQEGSLPWAEARALLPRLLRCFGRQHELFAQDDYHLLLAESAEMAWISTEGNAFNHATDRVADLEALARAQRERGRPLKDSIEVSATGRVRQTAFRAAEVEREFLTPAGVVRLGVPGSFYEFIERHPLPAEPASGQPPGLDLAFDAANATGIFQMTRKEAALA